MDLQRKDSASIYSVVWSQNPDMDTLYVCVGFSFIDNRLDIYAIYNVSATTTGRRTFIRLTRGGFSSFPSTNPEGTKIVYQSTTTRDHGHKNLYIMEDAQTGGDLVTQLTNGPWIDTHCQWSPRGNWIVFSSNRDKPAATPKLDDNGLDPGHFSIYLVDAADPTVVVRVVTSGDPGPGPRSIAGHVNHPVFSPDGRSITFSSDIAAVSAEPISMPVFAHSVRPYGDIFCVDIDLNDIYMNVDINRIHRVTHSRYVYSPQAWTKVDIDDPEAQWNMLVNMNSSKSATTATVIDRPVCPYVQADGGESWHMTGHLIVRRRCC